MHLLCFVQDVFDIQEGQRPLFKGRRVFLFEQALVITKQRRDNEGTYIIKEQFMVRLQYGRPFTNHLNW